MINWIIMEEIRIHLIFFINNLNKLKLYNND